MSQETNDLIGRLMLYSMQPGPAEHRSAMAAAAERLSAQSAEQDTVPREDYLRRHDDAVRRWEALGNIKLMVKRLNPEAGQAGAFAEIIALCTRAMMPAPHPDFAPSSASTSPAGKVAAPRPWPAPPASSERAPKDGHCLICGAPYTKGALGLGPCENGHSVMEEIAQADATVSHERSNDGAAVEFVKRIAESPTWATSEELRDDAKALLTSIAASSERSTVAGNHAPAFQTFDEAHRLDAPESHEGELFEAFVRSQQIALGLDRAYAVKMVEHFVREYRQEHAPSSATRGRDG